MPEQRLIDTVHMIHAADQMRVSEAITARDGALVQSASSVNNAGDVGHAPRGGGRRSNRPGNHKERRFRRNKRLKAQEQANAKRRRWQPGWQFRACIPDDRPQHGAHPPSTDNVHPAHPTGKFPRLQKVWPREQHSTPFTNRSDFNRYKGRTEAQIWQVDNPEEAERLLSVMRSISDKRPARSELQSTYELQWRIKNFWQPRSVFRHLVRTIWAEHDCQGQAPRYSNKDAQRWDRWIRFCTETHAVSTPAEMPALQDFFFCRHCTMTRAESILTLKAMALKHSELGLKLPCALERLHEWMTANRTASLVLPGPVWSGQIFIQRDPSVSKPCGLITGTLVTHDVVSTDSVDFIVSRFDGAGCLLGPSSTRRAYVQHEGHLSLAAGITLGDTYSILLRLRGGACDKETATPPGEDTRPAATSASLQPLSPPPDGRADEGSSSILNGFEAEEKREEMLFIGIQMEDQV